MSDFAARAQKAHREIAEIMMKEWDPIGVSGVPEANDEYDAYVAEVYRLLSRRASSNEIFEYLWWVETEHMALRGDRQRTLRVSSRLADLIETGVMPGS